jgi:hypothetical protein
LTRDPLGYKVSLRSEGEAVTPFHVSFHRGGGVRTLPNNFNWLANPPPAAAVREPLTGIAGFNMFHRRSFALDRIGEMNLYAYAASNPANLRDPFGLDYLWVSGDYKNNEQGRRYADLDIIWVQEKKEKGKVIAETVWPFVAHAVSGGDGGGPLPPGSYLGLSMMRTRDAKMMTDNFGWRMIIDSYFPPEQRHSQGHPLSSWSRPPNALKSGMLYMHPDGDGFGSDGCIAVDAQSQRTLFERLDTYLENNHRMDVFVTINGSGGEKVREYDRLLRSEAETEARVYDEKYNVKRKRR